MRVTAAGVNPLDWMTRSRGVFLGCPPFTVGADVVGVVGDVVLDPVGGDTAVRALPAIRDGGLLISVSSGADRARNAAAGRVCVSYLAVEPDDTGLEALAALAEAGALRAHVARMFRLEQAARAHRVGGTGRDRGQARHRRRMTSRLRPACRRCRTHRIQGATDG
jgi:NADPH:quinone reductase-like Zn-dependent oxidoreductase